MTGKAPRQPNKTVTVTDKYGAKSEQIEAVFVCSVFNRDRNTTAGSVALANRRLGAQRIIEGTHKVATPEEIEGYLDLQKANMLEREIADAKVANRKVFSLTVPGKESK
jgi:hypothetical protein